MKLSSHVVLQSISSRSPSGERGLKFRPPKISQKRKKSLPIRGAWIEISLLGGGWTAHRSLPIRGAWIEITGLISYHPSGKSLPIRGAWIEIFPGWCRGPWCPSRSPSGERGLKWPRPAQRGRGNLSLPIRGAWIEIPTGDSTASRGPCRSPSGERGLKYVYLVAHLVVQGRSPSGERGLK